MATPLDTQMLSTQMSGQELTRRKLEMDALRQRLSDPNARDKKLREAAEGFEAIFVQKIWQQMRATVPKEGYLHGKDEEFWQGMFDQELSKKMTEAGGIGLSDMLYEQLKGKINDASRTTAPSRVNNPLPLSPLREADTPEHPVKADIEEDTDPLYTPLDQEASTRIGDQAGKTADTESARTIAPPPFSENDKAVLTKVEELAKSIVREQQNVPGDPAPSGGPGPMEGGSTGEAVPSAMTPVSGLGGLGGLGGPVNRDPEMGMLNWPLPGRITSDFGWRNDPFTGQREWHAGVDIGGETGDPIAAAWDGIVVYAGEREGYGNLVVLEHEGGWRSYYGHTSKIDVEVGDEVRSGKKIAEVGNTGRSTGPHLHFEIRQGELAWNPEQVRNRLLAGLSVGRQS